MEDILIVILQALLEFLFDVLVNVGSWPSNWEPRSLTLSCLLGFLGGSFLAAVSIVLLRHTWIPFSALRVANLAAAPLSAAWLAQLIARRRQKTYTYRTVEPRSHYWRAFWFTLGLVAVRFAFATRPHSPM
jgi:hypothetical protein